MLSSNGILDDDLSADGGCCCRFLIGLELDVNALKTVGPKALVISASGIILPFALAVPITVTIKALDLSTVGFGYLYL